MPVKTVDKKTPGTTKRNADPAPPARGTGAGSRRGGAGGNDGGKSWPCPAEGSRMTD